MAYQNDANYLAKKIAEETVKKQKEMLNKRREMALKYTLIFVTVITGIFVVPFALISPSSLIVFAILLIVTIRYCKNHPGTK